MNGFANAILTLLLSWMRVLVNDLWRLFSSEGGGALYRFLAVNWKVIVLILCAGGFVVDRIIYLIRWRPYYVWSSKLGRLRRQRRGDEASEPALYAEEAAPPEAAPEAYADFEAPSFAPPETQAFAPAYEATRQYAPAQAFAPQQTQVYPPAQEIEPVFDDPDEAWDQGDALVCPLWDNPAEGMDSSFGVPRPEPVQYIRDMQAGFAPPRPPEELYAPPAPPPVSQQPAESADALVHPGLDAEAFERFGLTQQQPSEGEWDEEAWEDGGAQEQPVMRAPAFRPFTVREEPEPAHGDGVFRRLARRARDLIGVEDEDNRPTIHDLQSTVDVTQAFHDPVYPQPRDQQGGEE